MDTRQNQSYEQVASAVQADSVDYSDRIYSDLVGSTLYTGSNTLGGGITGGFARQGLREDETIRLNDLDIWAMVSRGTMKPKAASKAEDRKNIERHKTNYGFNAFIIKQESK